MFRSAPSKLVDGQMAPRFSAVDVMGKKTSLTHKNSRYVLLVFMRYSGCPWCNLAIHRLALEYPILQENGCEVITFIQSPASGIIKNIYERHARQPQFSIVADPDSKYYDLYRTTVLRGGCQEYPPSASLAALGQATRLSTTHGRRQLVYGARLLSDKYPYQ